MTKSQQGYPTDLNDTEWMQIAPYLPEPKATGRPREIAWREIMNGIFYMVKNGCVWRALPHDLPAWQTVYYYFRYFGKNEMWEKLNTIIRERVRVKEGREPQASAMSIDSQSVKSAEGGEKIGFDGGKLVKGRKRNLITDTIGLVVLARACYELSKDMSDGFDESMKHQDGKCQEMEAAKGFRRSLKVAGQSAKTSGPGKATLHDPAPG